MLFQKFKICSLHIWLYFSSFGIIFALLSFINDIKINNNQISKKGLLTIFLGFIFYLLIGLTHLFAAKQFTTTKKKKSVIINI